MSGPACLKNAFVKLTYLPPKNRQIPMDCTAARVIGNPEIVSDPFDPIDIRTFPRLELNPTYPNANAKVDLHCVVPSLSGAGSLIIILQVARFIRFAVGFKNMAGHEVIENHYVYVSMPVMLKIPGPRIGLMAITPLYLKTIPYTGMAVNAFRKLAEVEKVMGQLARFKKGICPRDIQALEDGLRTTEAEMNGLLRSVSHSQSESDIAMKMDRRGMNDILFAGTMVA